MKFCECGKMLNEYPCGGYYCTCGKKYDVDGILVESEADESTVDTVSERRKVYPNINDARTTKTHEAKRDVDYEIEILNKKPSTNEVSCPRCGSTQITAVTRKWSPLTGFLTNKVDRVCLNCKKKF